VNPDRVGAAQSVLFSGEELGTRITGIGGGGNTGPLGKEFSSESLERSNQRNAMNGKDRALSQVCVVCLLSSNSLETDESAQGPQPAHAMCLGVWVPAGRSRSEHRGPDPCCGH
jgi:hypothetical protein